VLGHIYGKDETGERKESVNDKQNGYTEDHRFSSIYAEHGNFSISFCFAIELEGVGSRRWRIGWGCAIKDIVCHYNECMYEDVWMITLARGNIDQGEIEVLRERSEVCWDFRIELRQMRLGPDKKDWENQYRLY